METLIVTLMQIVSSMPYFAAVFVLAFFGKWILDKTTPFNISEELTSHDNPAFGVAFAGYIVGLGIALSGSLPGAAAEDMVGELLSILLYGGTTVVLMRISIYLNDKAILYKFHVNEELVRDKNAGTGFVVAGSAVATGFMLKGVLSGHSETVLLGIRDVVIYFVVGQVILVLGALIFTWLTKYDVHEEIERDDNVAAGMSFGGFLAALGFISGTALTGATSLILEESITALVMALFGIVILLAARMIADKVLLPGSPLAKEVAEDQNPAAGAVAAASFLLVAVLFAGSIQPGAITESMADLLTGPAEVTEEANR
ncbi:MAG: DUF350 domain-containing protein [bacterium]|nr:DUF350 domain-containing protein [bacterium]